MLNLVSTTWLKSTTAYYILAVCTALTLPMILIFPFPLVDPRPSHPVGILFLNLGGMIGTLASLFLYVAMWKFWAHVDASPGKRAWFFVLLFGIIYGAVLYFWLAYAPQQRAGSMPPSRDESTVWYEIRHVQQFWRILALLWLVFLALILLAFVFPRHMPGPPFYLVCSLLLILATAGYGLRRIYLLGTRRDRQS